MVRQLLRVLLVEDNPGDAGLIRWMLRDAGEVRFELALCERLAEARERLAAERFSAVLLDLSLPDSLGLETFRAVHRACPQVPVVVLTGLADETMAVQAVQEGAQDYLIKGQVLDRHLAHALRYAVGRGQRLKGLQDRLEATEEEMRLARQVQQRLFPAGPPNCPGWDVAGASVPAGVAGGDFFDYLPWGGGRLGIAVGDVKGHGLAAALLMAATRAYLRAFAHTHDDLGRALTLTNRLLAADVEAGDFVTLLAAEADAARGTLRYANAGHWPGYVLGRDGEVRSRLYSTGLPLATEADEDFAAVPEVPLEPGDLVLFLTDGVIEAEAPSGDRFGADRALAEVRQHRELPAREVVDRLFAAVRTFVAGAPQDDVTVIVLKA